ncbi:MAG TPA: hypothetical protein VHU40_10915 [Polyangia bacterium]|nr:hypothetical protein [Polyangia bacterium]
MTVTKTSLQRVFLATGILLLSGGPLLAAEPAGKGEHPAAEKNAPAAPAKATPAPAPGPSTGPAVSARKGRGHF